MPVRRRAVLAAVLAALLATLPSFGASALAAQAPAPAAIAPADAAASGPKVVIVVAPSMDHSSGPAPVVEVVVPPATTSSVVRSKLPTSERWKPVVAVSGFIAAV